MIRRPPRSTLFPYTRSSDLKWGVKMHGLARMRCTCAASLSALAWSRSMAGSRHRSEEHTSELQSLAYLVCRLLLEKKKKYHIVSRCVVLSQNVDTLSRGA